MPLTYDVPIVTDAIGSCVEVAARFLADQPGAVDRVLAEHRNASDGHCLGCRAKPVRWPCFIVTIAQAACELASVGGGSA